MRIWSVLTTLVIGNMLTASCAVAQTTAASNGVATAPTYPQIALVDVGHILRNHPTMKTEIERIEASMKKADDEFTAKRDQILKQMEQLREQFTEGTPDYERQEKSIAEADTNFRLELVKKRKEFDEARAGVIFKIYNDLNLIVKHYCSLTGATLVMRVNREQMDPKKPETVQMVLSQEVLYFQPNADITTWVLDSLNQRAGATAPAAAAPAPGTASRPNTAAAGVRK